MIVMPKYTRIGLHVCYGNRYGKPSWEGSYRYLFPAILDAHIRILTLEFARRGGEDLDLFREFKPPFDLGVGVIDVKNDEIICEIFYDADDFFTPDRTPDREEILNRVQSFKRGGLGVYLVHTLVDKVEYRREGDRNVICLIKHI